MNEINYIIILNFNNEIEKIRRIIDQVKSLNISNAVIVGNNSDELKSLYLGNESIFFVDNNTNNINALLLSALQIVNGSFVCLSDNMILENDLMKYVTGSDFENMNVIFTTTSFPSAFDVDSDTYGNIIYVKENSNSKLCLNIFRVTHKYINNYLDYINNNKGYIYLDHIQDFNIPFKEYLIDYYYFSYDNRIDPNIDYKFLESNVTLVDVDKLHEIEDYSRERAQTLKEKILKEGIWNYPIVVEKNYYMILDGHHRFAVAKDLNLKKIPAVLVNYEDVKVWTLRKEIPVSVSEVKKRVIDEKTIHPYKTVKHKFPFVLPNIEVKLEDLK